MGDKILGHFVPRGCLRALIKVEEHKLIGMDLLKASRREVGTAWRAGEGKLDKQSGQSTGGGH